MSGTPSRQIAGIDIPDTPLVKGAIEIARAALDDVVFNHVMRSTLYGFVIGDSIYPKRDKELHAIAAILHELGWDRRDHSPYVSTDKRFEVDGANGARQFIVENVKDASWDRHRIQLLWDAIALHTTVTLSEHKEPEVDVTSKGIRADFLAAKWPGGQITQEVVDRVSKEFPYTRFKDTVEDCLTWICATKPATTYDNTIRDFGKYVPGFDYEGKTFESMAWANAPN